MWKQISIHLSAVLFLLVAFSLVGCASASQAASDAHTGEPMAESADALPTLTLLPSATVTASPTATVTPSPSATATPSPSPTRTPSPTITPSPTHDPNAEIEYEVVEGDTPGEIARLFQVDVSELMAYNGIDDPRHLQLGATIRVPVGVNRVAEMKATATAVAEATAAAVDWESAIAESLPDRVVMEMSHSYQKINNCAPTSTSMVLSVFGLNKTQFDMAAIQKPNPSDVNVTSEEVAASIRDVGLQAYVGYNGDILLLERLLAAGFPVLTEEWMSYDGGVGSLPRDSRL